MDINKLNIFRICNQHDMPLQQLQQAIIDSITIGSDPQKALDKLCLIAESIIPLSIAMIVEFDTKDLQLTIKSSPSLPFETMKSIEKKISGESAKSYKTIFCHPQAQYIYDTILDTCWLTPILGKNHQVMGAFVLSNKEKEPPQPHHKKLLEKCAHASGLQLNYQNIEIEKS